MADKREDLEQPRIQIVDNRMLSDDERQGKGGTPPKLEIVGGSNFQQNPNDVPDAPSEETPGTGGDSSQYPQGPAPIQEPDDEEQVPLTAEEREQIESEIAAAEAEQFAAIEERMGRPLTEQEKNAVRDEMARQAQSVASLEVAPMLQQFVVQMSQIAAIHMGLMPNPYTRLIARNDSEARTAIDSFAAILDVLRPQLDATSAREFDRVLNDLRVNFTQITGLPAGGTVGGLGGFGGFGGGNTGGSGPRIIH